MIKNRPLLRPITLALLLTLASSTPTRTGSDTANNDVYTSLAYAGLFAAGVLLERDDSMVSYAWYHSLKRDYPIPALMRTVGLTGLLFGSKNPLSDFRDFIKFGGFGVYLHKSGTGATLYNFARRS